MRPRLKGSVIDMPAMSATDDVTRLLAKWANGDQQALDELTPLVYKELRRLAASQLRKERRSHTLQPTALVHEAYLRLVHQRNRSFHDRAHFFGVAARQMRRILVDHARRRGAGKRVGVKVSLEDAVSFQQERSRDVVALDIGLTALENSMPGSAKPSVGSAPTAMARSVLRCFYGSAFSDHARGTNYLQRNYSVPNVALTVYVFKLAEGAH